MLVVYLSGHGVSAAEPLDNYFFLTATARTLELTDPGVRSATLYRAGS